jgi:hypothetical protein
MEKYWAALLPEGADKLVLHCFDTLEAMAAHLQPLPPTTAGVLFKGARLHVTRGPWRYLVDGEQQVPLFATPKLGKVDHSTALGQRADAPAGPDQDYQALMKTLPLTEPEVAMEEDTLPDE